MNQYNPFYIRIDKLLRVLLYRLLLLTLLMATIMLWLIVMGNTKKHAIQSYLPWRRGRPSSPSMPLQLLLVITLFPSLNTTQPVIALVPSLPFTQPKQIRWEQSSCTNEKNRGSASDYCSSKIDRINRETEGIAAKLSKLYQPLKLPGLAAAR